MKHPSLVRILAERAILIIVLAAAASIGQAQLLYQNGVGITVYGVTGYGGAPQPAPVFNILNNQSGRFDILASPGGGFLTASPVIANNISQTPPNVPLPLGSFQAGGFNGNGPFGASANLITGPNIGFYLRDFGVGGGSASYTISTWTANFTVGAAGFNKPLIPILSVGGGLLGGSGGSADAVSLVTSYSINGGAAQLLPALVLAAAGNGNKNAVGGAGAAVVFGPGFSSFRGFAFDLSPVLNLNPGDTVTALTTLTALADPADINSLILGDLNPDGLFNTDPDAVTAFNLMNQQLAAGAFEIAGTVQAAPTPDIANTAALLGAAFVTLATLRRRLSA